MQEPRSVLLFQLWRRAEERAAAAEKALFDASLLSSTGGPSPKDDQWKRAKQLRAEAGELFKAAMAEVDRANREAARLTSKASLRSSFGQNDTRTD